MSIELFNFFLVLLKQNQKNKYKIDKTQSNSCGGKFMGGKDHFYPKFHFPPAQYVYQREVQNHVSSNYKCHFAILLYIGTSHFQLPYFTNAFCSANGHSFCATTSAIILFFLHFSGSIVVVTPVNVSCDIINWYWRFREERDQVFDQCV